MAWLSNIFISVVIFSISALVLLTRHRKATSQHRLPSGPSGWPIVGNLFDLGSMPHRTLADLRQKYGPVIWLRLGSMNTMVILSAKAAERFFKNHDLEFADRNVTEVMRARDYNQGSVALAPYGSHWRLLRRLVTIDMLVNKRINETAFIRWTCVDQMLQWIEEESNKTRGGGIQVARFVFLMTFNMLGNLMLSRDLLDPESKDAAEFFTAMTTLMEWSGHANIADYLPWLKWLDPQGLRRKMERDLGKAMAIASKFVKERVQEKEAMKGDRKKDFLDVLLEFEGNGKGEEPTKISDRDINIFILEIFMAGSETTSSTIEWAITELLLNPESMSEAKAELAQVIGADRKVEESDIDNLPFMQAVVKETLRCHPPIPFLVPRKAIHDTNFMGYDIPKNTQVLVNTWAIGRDPDAWEDPSSFKPERFIRSTIDFKGQHHELIPFGSGRRMCAGLSLAHRTLHIILGSLLHEFNWELDPGIDPATMDMKDRLGVTTRKFEPLLVVPKKCSL
uniref:Cytochrome P450 n=1 Tax=Rhizophora mucronata TaxID=61149 RepID=A0A2P2J2F3_RHIMU